MTDLVPISLAQTLAAIRADLAELHRAIERATITPAPEWVTMAGAANLVGVHRITIKRAIDAGKLQTNGHEKSLLRVKVDETLLQMKKEKHGAARRVRVVR